MKMRMKIGSSFEKGKSVERWRRKGTGLRETMMAGLPNGESEYT